MDAIIHFMHLVSSAIGIVAILGAVLAIRTVISVSLNWVLTSEGG